MTNNSVADHDVPPPFEDIERFQVMSFLYDEEMSIQIREYPNLATGRFRGTCGVSVTIGPWIPLDMRGLPLEEARDIAFSILLEHSFAPPSSPEEVY